MKEWETPLYHMIQTVDINKEPWEQLGKLKKFDNLPQEQFDELVSGPYNKEEGAAIVMQYLHIERFSNKLRGLLGYLMDFNWPAASRVADLLASIGEPVLPEIKRIFREDKTDWIWLTNIIRGVIKTWDEALIRQLQDELVEIVGYADNEGASIAALNVLQRVLTQNEFDTLYQYLQAKYSDDASLTEDLRYYFDN